MSEEPSVLVLSAAPKPYLEALHRRFPSLAVSVCGSYEALPAALDSTRPRAVLASKLGSGGFPRELLLGATSIEWIQCDSAGVDHLLPIPGATLVSSASGVHDEALSDYVIGHVLAANLHFRRFLEQQRERVWQPHPLVPAAGQKLVVLGYGSIGRRTAAKARGLGMDVVGVRRHPDPPERSVVGLDGLASAVAEADFLVVTLPRTPKTLGLVSAEVLSSMKRGAVLINISRGGIVDESALARELADGPLASAVMDVFATEPLPVDSALWSLDNLVVTPHTGDVLGWQEKIAALFCDNLARFLGGEKPENLVSSEHGY